MVWFKASGTPSILDPHQNSSQSHGDLMVLFPQDQSLHTLQQVIDGLDIRLGHPKAQDMGQVIAELVNVGHWDWPLRQGAEPVHLCPW